MVVNGRKILRMWQKGSMCQMLLQRTKVALYFPSAELCSICIELNYLPLHCTLALAQPLCQGLSTGVDNGEDEDEDIDSSDTLHADFKAYNGGAKRKE